MKSKLSHPHPSRSLVLAAALVGILALGTAHGQGYTGPRGDAPAAQRSDGQRRYAGPSSLSVTTVKQLLDQGRDDQKAMLRGRIVSWDGGKHYTFDDGSGQIRLEIKARRFPAGSSIDDKTTVELYGELERKRRGVKFEVDQLRIVE